MQWRDRTLSDLAYLICGDDAPKGFFPYRSSSHITRFFHRADTEYSHDGSTRNKWVAATLAEILNELHQDARTLPDAFCRVIRTLMDPADAINEGSERIDAMKALNVPLNRESFEAFYADDKQCHLRHLDPV